MRAIACSEMLKAVGVTLISDKIESIQMLLYYQVVGGVGKESYAGMLDSASTSLVMHPAATVAFLIIYTNRQRNSSAKGLHYATCRQLVHNLARTYSCDKYQ